MPCLMLLRTKNFAIQRRVKSRTLSKIERLPPDYWVFQFGSEVVLSTQSQWRVFSCDCILLTSEDDGQSTALQEPVDAQVNIRELLQNRVATRVEVDQATADFTIHFDNGNVFQIVNLSSGYEAWELSAEGDHLIVGRNGCS